MWAYPRGCGGTSVIQDNPDFKLGLSPRVRGNPGPGQKVRGAPGHIPAGAGEPSPCGRSFRRRGAYPHGCGGTLHKIAACSPYAGLSPRVRGNLRDDADLAYWIGPIPAGAGEPCRRACGAPGLGAYPRGCGGTAFL